MNTKDKRLFVILTVLFFILLAANIFRYYIVSNALLYTLAGIVVLLTFIFMWWAVDLPGLSRLKKWMRPKHQGTKNEEK